MSNQYDYGAGYGAPPPPQHGAQPNMYDNVGGEYYDQQQPDMYQYEQGYNQPGVVPASGAQGGYGAQPGVIPAQPSYGGQYDGQYDPQYAGQYAGQYGASGYSGQYGEELPAPRGMYVNDGASEAFSDFTMRTGGGGGDYYDQGSYMQDGYGNEYDASAYSQPYGGMRSGASTPYNGGLDSMAGSASMQGGLAMMPQFHEPYPAWTVQNQVPISKEQIEDIFIDLANKFGFQRDSMRNMYDHLLTLLDSRASRMTPNQALLSLHADYIGGDQANYRKWYFAAQIDLDDEIGFRNMKLGKTPKNVRKAKKKSKMLRKKNKDVPEVEPASHNTLGQVSADQQQTLEELEGDYSIEAGEYRWKTKMNSLSQQERVRQIALYILLWGEANQVRFCPEVLCYIYKCADDYFMSPECQSRSEPVPEGDFLNRVITPIYQFMRGQVYEISNGRYVKRERDHNSVIGYDDINQLFWYPEGIERICFEDGTRMIDVPQSERYFKLGEVVWNKVFFKTYKESRSWFHMATNFNRIWIIHIVSFWYYAAYNSPFLYTKDWNYLTNFEPLGQTSWAVASIGGVLAVGIQLIATISEYAFVPRKWAGAQSLANRMWLLIGLLCLNLVTPVYVLGYLGFRPSKSGLAVGIVGFLISLFTFLFFSIMPLGGLFGSYLRRGTRRYVSSQTFTANFPSLKGVDMWLSYIVWIVVFGAKLSESYFFLILPIRDPIHDLGHMRMRCIGETWFAQGLSGDAAKEAASKLCRYQPQVVLGVMYATDLCLFFLDTYLWYIIVNTVFSVGRSFYLGVSIWTPWRNIFSRLPKRIYSKVLATNDMEIKYKPKVLISQIWNAIVISMYREHLLAIDHVQMLLYHQVPSEVEGKRTLRAPTFFVAQDDNQVTSEFFPSNSEAERRISFFAQSLSTPMPEPLPVDNMPTFSVMVPHYGEKILLSLREIIREEDQYTRVTLLEYLKQLHPVEWECFVKDTKILAEESNFDENGNATTPGMGDKELDADATAVKNKTDDLPFYCIGFKSAAPEYTLRTRIWASLRSQTLYRTVSGFMNYSRAIKLLYRVENPEVVQMFGGNTERLEMELERMARRKFRFLISMQRLAKFRPDEMENAEFLLRAYPDLQIAYLDEEPAVNEGDEPRVFSAVIDGHCEIMENGRRRPKFRIQLSGNPILGDGKADNQNHALIFYRGEYLQLIDANQDNYLEECLKIRSVLAEFEELNMDIGNPYVPGIEAPLAKYNPVAIVGAREYIFSENVGILGDVAAGKEQTFGTLFARTLSQVGAKLHYGHPDFLNAIFMTTRGGVSKAQKGLHLNEDIYVGMNAVMRGGRIKHCEYFQCGKGRDLGFSSILNFTTKIGTGMGEQMLSREYYYMGTQLPLDRFLSFFYAHPGFHINNMFIIISVQMFMISLMNIGSLSSESVKCWYDSDKPQSDPHSPLGCYMLQPVNNWIDRCVLSIFIVFFISFVPLVVQELCERGLWRATQRFAKHFASLSPMFEVFVCQVYASSLVTNLSFGGARYIGTGRGVATRRVPFSVLFARFSSDSIYSGSRSLLMLLFGTISMWRASLLWFWLTLMAMITSPFLYNPHQFAWTDFIIDYRDFIRWLTRGNGKWHTNSWIGYVRLTRTRITGYKRKLLGDVSERETGDSNRIGFFSAFLSEVFIPLIMFGCAFIPFLFINAQTGVNEKNNADYDNGQGYTPAPTNSILRVIICSLGPIAVNAGVVFFIAMCACFCGPLTALCCKRTASVMAGISHGFGVIFQLIFFEVMWFFEGWDFRRALLGTITCILLQRLICKILIAFCVTREFRADNSNRAWWSGKWYGSHLGWMAWTQPAREFLVKIVENEMFGGDFLLGHLILFLHLPLLVIPQIDKWHSILLFWLKPSQHIRPPIFSVKQEALRKRMVKKYATLYFSVLILYIIAIVAPAAAGPTQPKLDLNGIDGGDSPLNGLLQPRGLKNNDTGENATTSWSSTWTKSQSYTQTLP